LTNVWQRKMREISAKDSFVNIYHEKFGDDAYAKIKEMAKYPTPQSQFTGLFNGRRSLFCQGLNLILTIS